MNNLIHDRSQINEFLDMCFFEHLKPYEGIFISMACRNKYVTDEKRVYYQLTGTEMFTRQVLVDEQKVIPWLERYVFVDGDLQGYYSKSGKNLPMKATTCYININPTSGIQVAEGLNKFLAQAYSDAMLHGEKSYYRFRKITNEANKLYQKSRSVKNWIDIDIDFEEGKKDIEVLKSLCNSLEEKEVEFIKIETRSGYHVMMKRETVSFNYNELLRGLRIVFSGEVKEIEVNKNEMLPLPGTLQAGFPVTLIN